MSDMLSSGNRVLLSLLFRRFKNWDPADRTWVLSKLAADDRDLRKPKAPVTPA